MKFIRTISLKAVLIGVAVQIVGSILSGFVLGTFLSYTSFSPDEAADFMKGDFMLGMKIVIGMAIAVLAGWVTGQFTDRARILNAGVMAAICLLIGLSSLGGHPPWFGLTVIVAAIPAGMLGGYLAGKWRF